MKGRFIKTLLLSYAGWHERPLKSLSADEIKQYLSGAGMGYAKPAELNHFPGPMHVLGSHGGGHKH